MRNNPILNAVLAAAYIVLVALVMHNIPQFAEEKDPLIAPIAFLSLLTLSAATMGYLFLSVPMQLFLEGEKQRAVKFFLKTLASFAIITLVIFSLIFLGIAG